MFDWHVGGHDAAYMRAYAKALAPVADVVTAAPRQTLSEVEVTDVDSYELASARPRPGLVDPASGGRFGKGRLASAELDLLDEVVAAVRPDHLVHLFADPVVRWLIKRPALPTQVSLCIHFAQSHFRRAYGHGLGPIGEGRARFKDLMIARWARRPDARAMFFNDEAAAAGWRRRGAPAFWAPEPPLDQEPRPLPWEQRRGAVLFGYLDERKGIDRLARAVGTLDPGTPLLLTGPVAPEFEAELSALIGEMRSAGAEVETALGRQPLDRVLERLGAARCAVLSFGWKPSGSRVLVEAAASGTPVLGAEGGTVGHLIRRYGVGLAVDPDDPAAIASGLRALLEDPATESVYSPGLRDYAAEVGGTRFASNVRAGLGLA